MAKDGTARGGARVGAGKKRKALVDKIADGDMPKIVELPKASDFEPKEMPPVKEYMKEEQKHGDQQGGDLCAEEIYKETWEWLRDRGCEELVTPQLIQDYAMMSARRIQCERAISRYGFISKHPTTGQGMNSPFVKMSQDYMKQANQIWYQIYQVVKENCSVAFDGATPQDDIMDRLLKMKAM